MEDKVDDRSKAFTDNYDAASPNETQFGTSRLRTKSSRKKRRRRSLMYAASKKVPPYLPPPPTPEVPTSAPVATEPCAHTDETSAATRENPTHVQSLDERYGHGMPVGDVFWHGIYRPTYPQDDRKMAASTVRWWLPWFNGGKLRHDNAGTWLKAGPFLHCCRLSRGSRPGRSGSTRLRLEEALVHRSCTGDRQATWRSPWLASGQLSSQSVGAGAWNGFSMRARSMGAVWEHSTSHSGFRVCRGSQDAILFPVLICTAHHTARRLCLSPTWLSWSTLRAR